MPQDAKEENRKSPPPGTAAAAAGTRRPDRAGPGPTIEAGQVGGRTARVAWAVAKMGRSDRTPAKEGKRAMMEYRGYKAQIDFDDDAGLFHGEVINTREGIAFRGRTVDELRQGFREAVDGYLDWCARCGTGGLPAFSGRLSVRLPPELHRSVAAAARRDGKNISTWIAERLGEVVERGAERGGADAR